MEYDSENRTHLASIGEFERRVMGPFLTYNSKEACNTDLNQGAIDSEGSYNANQGANTAGKLESGRYEP